MLNYWQRIPRRDAPTLDEIELGRKVEAAIRLESVYPPALRLLQIRKVALRAQAAADPRVKVIR